VKALISFYQSSIGKKWIVALTGLVLVGFVVGHLIGNLQIFLGQEAINLYAERLQGLGDILWGIRLFLLAVIVVHIVSTVLLAIQNKAARPQKYAIEARQKAGLASRTMLISGLIVTCFIVYHLLHFTAQTFHPEWKTWHDAENRHDVYSMMIVGFRDPLSSLFYIVGVGLLCMHLSHGIQSFLQTLGARTHSLAKPISKASPIIALLIFVGYISIPVASLLHIINPTQH
jgi:succinate dehydrogenase / fumarate reductase cytochrome b subunit